MQVPSIVLRNLTIPTGAGISWSKPFILLNCFAAPLFLLVVSESTRVLIPIGSIDFPLWGIMLIISAVLATFVFFTSNLKEPPKYFFILVGLNIIMSSSWLYMVGLEFVSVLVIMAKVLKLSTVTVGILFVGLANSYIAITGLIKLVRQDFIILAISCILALVPLKMMLCLGFAFALTSFFTPDNHIYFESETTGFNSLLEVFVAQILVGVVYAIMMPVLRFRLKWGLAVVMVLIWGAGTVVVVLSELGIIFSGPIISRSAFI